MATDRSVLPLTTLSGAVASPIGNVTPGGCSWLAPVADAVSDSDSGIVVLGSDRSVTRGATLKQMLAFGHGAPPGKLLPGVST